MSLRRLEVHNEMEKKRLGCAAVAPARSSLAAAYKVRNEVTKPFVVRASVFALLCSPAQFTDTKKER